MATSTSLGKKLISITNNTFLIAANRYVIPETTPSATDKSPLSPLAFSAMENREDVSTQLCKKERLFQHLLHDSLLPLITYSTFRARHTQLAAPTCPVPTLGPLLLLRLPSAPLLLPSFFYEAVQIGNGKGFQEHIYEEASSFARYPKPFLALPYRALTLGHAVRHL